MVADIVRHPEYATVERTIVDAEDDLAALYGAHHVGVSKKFRAGEKLSETCITFYVAQKGTPASGEPVPPEFPLLYEDGSRERSILTDVCELGGRPRGFNMRGGNVVIGADNEHGTVGLVFRRGNRDLFLTNAHVVTDPGQQPGLVSVEVPDGPIVQGIVSDFDDLLGGVVRSDAAIVQVATGTIASGSFRGTELRLVGCGEIANNDSRRFYYVAMEFVHEAVWLGFVPGAAEIDIDGHSLNYAGFHKLRLTVGRCRPGHSGAVVFCRSGAGLMAVGLLFGGIEDANEVWVFPVRRCLRQMNIDPDSL